MISEYIDSNTNGLSAAFSALPGVQTCTRQGTGSNKYKYKNPNILILCYRIISILIRL